MTHDWAQRVFEVIEDHRNREFVWAESDCCMFAFRVRDAKYGSDIAVTARKDYHDEKSALRVIASRGGLKNTVSHYLGDPTEERATRGDVVMIDGGEGDAIGVCMGMKVLCMGPSGLREVPRSEIKAVWK